MTQETKQERIQRAKSEANSAKDRLISIMHELQEIGAVRQATSLEVIIIKLECWQNR